MVAVGLNDSGVVGTLEAAEQLGRAQDILGWGQDGSLITGNDVTPICSAALSTSSKGTLSRSPC